MKSRITKFIRNFSVSRRQRLLVIAGALLLLLILYFSPKDRFFIDSGGRAHFPFERGPLQFSEATISEDADYKLLKVSFESRGTRVFGQLWLPKNAFRAPALLFLPGAGGTKEAGGAYAEMFRGKGMAVFALDQRGFGETLAGVPGGLQEEYADFLAGREYFQILMVYDALRAFDYLSKKEGIDGSRIMILGESMGGRNAIIAGALESRLRLVVGISTGGYAFEGGREANLTRFIRSIDPDNYIAMISPRKTVLFHSTADKVQPFAIGERTYAKAIEPKVLYRMGCATHGLCDEMIPLLKKEIDDAIR